MCTCCKGGKCVKKSRQIRSDDVYYTGPYLPNLGIPSNTNFTTILQIINTIFGSTGSSTLIIRMFSEVGTTITNPDLIGKSVQFVIIDDYTKNLGFTKLLISDTITFTDGTVLTEGQVLTIIAN